MQPQVGAKVTDQTAEKRKKIAAEAVAGLNETKNALRLIDEKKAGEALAALEQATGKLELIFAREPELAFAPVDIKVLTYDLLAWAAHVADAELSFAVWPRSGSLAIGSRPTLSLPPILEPR